MGFLCIGKYSSSMVRIWASWNSIMKYQSPSKLAVNRGWLNVLIEHQPIIWNIISNRYLKVIHEISITIETIYQLWIVMTYSIKYRRITIETVKNQAFWPWFQHQKYGGPDQVWGSRTGPLALAVGPRFPQSPSLGWIGSKRSRWMGDEWEMNGELMSVNWEMNGRWMGKNHARWFIWWFQKPSETYERQLGWLESQYIDTLKRVTNTQYS